MYLLRSVVSRFNKSQKKDSQELLNNIRIAAPCPVSWESMSGDDQIRFCGSCEKNVFDISALSADAAVKLIREKQGDVCIQMYRRRDGTVLTEDCPKGLKRLRQGLARRIACVAAAFGFLGSAAADAQTTSSPKCSTKDFGGPMRGRPMASSTQDIVEPTSIVDPTSPQMNDVQSTTPIVVVKKEPNPSGLLVLRVVLIMSAGLWLFRSWKQIKRKPGWVSALLAIAICAFIGFSWM